MKILIIHGDNIQASYEKFTSVVNNAKSKNWQIIHLNEQDDMKKNLTTPSLWPEKRLFVLENLNKVKKNDFDWLCQNADRISGNLIIYESNFLPAIFLKKFKINIKINEFKLPKLIFTFLDSLLPGNLQALKFLPELVRNQPPESIFALAARRFKDLYWVKSDPSSINYEGWRINRLKKQADKYSLDKLKEIINGLAKIDIETKTSKADLCESFKLLIVKELS